MSVLRRNTRALREPPSELAKAAAASWYRDIFKAWGACPGRCM